MTAQQIGKYSVLERLGRGGIGEVYLARDPELDRRVALKVLRAELGADRVEGRALLRSEARAVAALNHPNIVTVYEVGRSGDRDFIAMEYIDGDSMRDLLSGGPLPLGELIGIARPVGAALAAAHRAGVHHRDIKPDNVMVGDEGVVKVVDFGIARRLGAGESPSPITAGTAAVAETFAQTLRGLAGAPSETAMVYGTPGYMPPEVATAQSSDAAADVYSFGVLLFEALAGQLPYEGASPLEYLDNVVDPTVAPASIDTLRPDAPEALSVLIMKMIAYRAADRPSIDDVSRALDSLAPSSDSGPMTRSELESLGRRGVERAAGPGFAARSRSVVIAVVLVVGVAAALAVMIARTTGDSERALPAKLKLAVEPPMLSLLTTGNQQPSTRTYARAIATLLDAYPDVSAIATSELEGPAIDPVKRAKRAGRTHIVRGAIIERDGTQTIELSLVSTDDERVAAKHAQSTKISIDSAAQVGGLAGAVQSLLASAELGPLDPASSHELARVLYDLGSIEFGALRWAQASVFFDQAAALRPGYFEAYFRLALARGWSGAPGTRTAAAAKRALEHAPDDGARDLMTAFYDYNRGYYGRASQRLAAIVAARPRDRDVLYLYAESLFHDGRIDESLEWFDKVIEVSPRFKLGSVHQYGVAQARKDATTYKHYASKHRRPGAGMVSYLAGDDVKARAQGFSAAILDAVGGDNRLFDSQQKGTGSLTRLSFRAARALEEGNPDALPEILRAAWVLIDDKPDSSRVHFELRSLVGVLIIGEHEPSLRKLERFFEKHETAENVETRRHIAIFGAPVLGAVVTHEPLSRRLQSTARALEAEQKGDIDTAVASLEKLERERSGRHDDYLIAHAYGRVLARAVATEPAARATLAAHCKDWSRPGHFRPEMFALRGQCKRWLAALAP